MALGEKIDDCTEEQMLGKIGLFDRLNKKHQKFGFVVKNLIHKTNSEEESLYMITSMQEKEVINVAREIKLLKFKYNLP